MISKECSIQYLGKNRNGSKKFWCNTHKILVREELAKENTCIKYGQIEEEKRLRELFIEDYQGGIGIWGALNAIFTNCDHDKNISGVHVHTRKTENVSKDIDDTFDIVLIKSHKLKDFSLYLEKDNAIAFTLGQVADREIVSSICPHCKCIHLDKDWFAVNYHKKHQCDNCGRDFFDKKPTN
jgi:hypothetical protein